MGRKFPEHTAEYKINGVWRAVEKVRYADEEAALVGITRLLSNPEARIHPRGYNAYQCQHCHLWHVGRGGKHRIRRAAQTDRTIALDRLYWALWRYANGKPVQRHNVHSRSPRTDTPILAHSIADKETYLQSRK
jgi:hypothetical protein